MNKFISILSHVPTFLGAGVVAIEAAAEKGLVNANSPVLKQVLGWSAIASIFLSAFQGLQVAPAPVAAPAPAPAAPVAPAAA